MTFRNLSFKGLKAGKGMISMFMVIALPVLIMLTGLVVDTGRAYIAKAKLFSAVDAAGIAAARAASSSTDSETAARTAAQRYFDANIPSSLMNSVSVMTNFTFTETGQGESIIVDITGQVTIPTTFVKFIGIDTWSVTAQSQTIRRPVDISLVLDDSGSLSSVGDTVETRTKQFVSNFNPGFDRVAISKFGFGANTPEPFQSTRQFNAGDINDAIEGLDFSYTTNTAGGFAAGYSQFKDSSVDPVSASLKVLVIFTDGAPNTFIADFENTGTSSNYSDGSNSCYGALSTRNGTSSTAHGIYNPTQMGDSVKCSNPNISDNESSNSDTEWGTWLDLTSSTLTLDGVNIPLLDGPRAAPSTQTYAELVRAISRDVPEKMAEEARKKGIYVFTLGLGPDLLLNIGNGSGEDMLYRMANDPRMQTKTSPTDLTGDYKTDQPAGLYCYAADESQLGPCYDKMLDVIIRLTL